MRFINELAIETCNNLSNKLVEELNSKLFDDSHKLYDNLKRELLILIMNELQMNLSRELNDKLNNKL